MMSKSVYKPAMMLTLIFILAMFISIQAKPIEDVDKDPSETEDHRLKSISCDDPESSEKNINLFQFLNDHPTLFVSVRSKNVFGSNTWKNAIIKTSTDENRTVYVNFVAENENATCLSSEQGEISLADELDRVHVRWLDRDGYIKALLGDQFQIHLVFCYKLEKIDECLDDQTEHLISHVNSNYSNYESMNWLKSHCSHVNDEDFVISDNFEKCFSNMSRSIVSETRVKSGKETDSSSSSVADKSEEVDENSAEVTTSISKLDTEPDESKESETAESNPVTSTSDSNNSAESAEETTSKLDVSGSNQHTTTVSATEVSSPTTESVNENSTSVENTANSTDSIAFNESNTASYDNNTVLDNSNRTGNDTIVENVVNTENATTVEIETVLNSENATVIDLHNETQVLQEESSSSSAVSNATIDEDLSTSVDFTTGSVVEDNLTGPYENESVPNPVHKSGEIESIDFEVSTINRTTEVSKTKPAISVDCLPLNSCQIETCNFGRKSDHRGCPTCNCLPPPENSNFTCPRLTCLACLYGHEIDSNGCPTCQCQHRPHPPYGERCPNLNCEPCYFGTVKDEYNCDTCICIRPNNQECPTLNCLFGPCKHGSILDKDNCPSCDCLLPKMDSSLINCTDSSSCPPCYLGYVKDADGCETCQCKQRSSVSCPPLSSNCVCRHGSYLDSNGCETCLCLPDPTSAPNSACWEMKSQMPEINCATDGSFAGRQCNVSESKCWCVTTRGIAIDGFQSRPDENVNCACATELYQVSSLRMVGHHLSCLPNGNYAPIQCDERYCSCVDENGKSIGPSVSNQNRDLLRCVGVYQHLHPDRLVLTQETFGQSNFSSSSDPVPSSLCFTHLEQVRKADVEDEHILIPTCDSNGLYEAIQCDQTGRYCWCVDKKTGVELEGTRRLNARPYCINE